MNKAVRLFIASKVLSQLLREAEEFAKQVNFQEGGLWKEVCRLVCEARLAVEDALAFAQLKVEQEEGVFVAFPKEVSTGGLLDPRFAGD